MSYERTLTKLAITTMMTGLLFVGMQSNESTVYAHSQSPTTQTETPQHSSQHKHRHGGISKDAAQLLGMESQELFKEWKKGKTLIQIAKDRKGWDEETFTQKLSEIQLKKIDNAIKTGKVSKEQGDMIKQKLPEKLKNAVNHKHRNNHEIQQGTFSNL